MTDKEILLSRVNDKISEADKNTMITHTSFLSVDELNDVILNKKRIESGIRCFYYGGIAEAERKAVFFVPECFDIKDISLFFSQFKEENPLTAVKVTKDRFSELSHRDYLGALMGLGIKREQIGDIITVDDGAFVICFKNIAGFICENLSKGGRATLKCVTTSIDNIVLPEEKIEIRFHSVASLRLDNIISAGFSVPRSQCEEYINKGMIFVNSVRAIKCDTQIKLNDKIVLRGKGKIVLSEIIGENKKGRVHINIRHYI